MSDPVELEAGESYAFRLEFATTNPRDGLDPGPVRLGWLPPQGTLSPVRSGTIRVRLMTT